MVMDYGESESILLYEELKADYLLIDDNKARMLAESLNINCIFINIQKFIRKENEIKRQN